MYLEVKIPRNNKIKYLESSSHQTKCRYCFQMLNCFKKGTTDLFKRCKATQKALRMYLELYKLKISREWGTDWLEAKNPTKTDAFRGQNATDNVRVTFFEVKMHRVTSGQQYK